MLYSAIFNEQLPSLFAFYCTNDYSNYFSDCSMSILASIPTWWTGCTTHSTRRTESTGRTYLGDTEGQYRKPSRFKHRHIGLPLLNVHPSLIMVIDVECYLSTVAQNTYLCGEGKYRKPSRFKHRHIVLPVLNVHPSLIMSLMLNVI